MTEVTGVLPGWRGAKLTATILVALVASAAVAVALGGASLAATDYDGDGAISNDCAPLDPAVHPAATDRPDLAFEDLDCDGIDGDRDGAFFVAPSGSDANAGTPNAPFATVGKGVAAAGASRDVYVATGTYNESVSVPSAADGVGIYGGYVAGTWGRTTTAATVVNGSPQAMVLSGAENVVVQLMTLNGSSSTFDRSAYGVRAISGSEVALIRTSVTAGDGANGVAGSGGSTPFQAASGQPGQWGADCNTPGEGGAGGGFSASTAGGSGGDGGDDTRDGENGLPGSRGGGTRGGHYGAGGVDPDGDSHGPSPGADGRPGSPGGTGSPGVDGVGGAANFDATNSYGWAGHGGTSGSRGDQGGGGGGGGGGAGRGNFTDWGTGSGGGGGGEGGTGGAGASGGGYGGGSFGVYAYDSKVTVVDGAALRSGAGGAGGAGGTGGAGGAGGEGGAGGPARTDCGISLAKGGDGGDGGQGGRGGHGGGGSGGPSAAMMVLGNNGGVYHKGSTLNPGSGGAGGTSSGSAGSAGRSGAVLGLSPSPTDFDNDGMTDAVDACVEIARGTTDNNGDGCPDRPARLSDRDGDGVPDGVDACPDVAASTESGCPPDAVSPTVTDVSPKNRAKVRDTTPTIRATVLDNVTTLQKADIRLVVAGKTIDGTKYVYDPETGALLYNSRKLPKGKKKVEVTATDAAGNTGTFSWSFTIR